MAEIRDILAERKKRQQDNEELDYKEKIRAHKLSVFIRHIVGLAVLVGIIVISNVFWKEKVYSGINVVNSVPVSVVTGATAANLSGNLLIYSKDGASCVDTKGKAIWNESYEMQSPIVSINGSTVAIGDYNGREVYVANKEGLLGTVRTNLPIRNVAVSDNGVVAAVLDDKDVIRIFVYNANTDTEEPIVQAKATMNKSGYPISVALSPNGKIMMVSYFYVDSGNMKSSVSFYNFGEVGSNKVDNFVSGFDYVNSVLPYVTFMDNNSAFGVGNDRLVLFSGDEIPDNIATAMMNENIRGIYHNEGYIALVFSDTTGEGIYRVDIYSDRGNKLSSIFTDIEYTDIVLNKENVVIYGGKSCSIYTNKGQEKFSGSFEKDINLMMPTTSSYKFTVVTKESMENIEID